MEIKSCETCKFGWNFNCHETACGDCPVADEFGFCRCVDIEDINNCPHYKKYEPTPSANEISSEEINIHPYYRGLKGRCQDE